MYLDPEAHAAFTGFPVGIGADAGDGVVAVCGSQACQPVPVPIRPPTDFLWQRNPFQLAGGALPTVESAGIDYILPYWMARYYAIAADLL